MKRLVEVGAISIGIARKPWRNDDDNILRVFEGVTWRFQWKVFVPIMIAIAIAVPVAWPGMIYVAREMPDSWINHVLLWWASLSYAENRVFSLVVVAPVMLMGLFAYANLLRRARVKALLADRDLWDAAWKRGLVRLRSRQVGLAECASPYGDWVDFVARFSADSF